jgi:hypothetical protein
MRVRSTLGLTFAALLALAGHGAAQTPGLAGKAVFRVGSSGPGHGSVTSVPPGIDCPSLCTGRFPAGATVVLVATPRATSRFAGWSGGCVGLSSWCILTAERNASVAAWFVRESGSFEEVGSVFVTRPVLNVTRAGAAGEIRSSPAGIECPPVGGCSSRFDRGERVTLRAIPPQGYVFVRWSGLLVSCSGSGPCSLRLNTTTDVTATFRPAG